MKSNAVVNRKITTKKIVYCGLLIAISVVLKLLFEIYIPLGGFPSLRINLNSIPIILTGMTLGPVYGFVVGVISDLLCYVVKPGGPLFLGFTLSSGLTGLIPGILWKLLKNRRIKFINWTNLIFSIVSVVILFLTSTISYSNGQFLYMEEPISPIILGLFFLLILLFSIYPFIATRILNKNEARNSENLLLTISIEQIIDSVLLNTLWLTILYGQAWMVLLPARIITNFFLIPIYSLIILAILKILPKNFYKQL